MLIGAIVATLAVPFTLYMHRERAQIAPAPVAVALPKAEFGDRAPAMEVRKIADWIAQTGNAGNTGFVIVDKKNAQVYVFDAAAHLQGASEVLLGAARGDDSSPGIGKKPLSAIPPAQRTTPAGRFIAEPGHNTHGNDIVWVDYGNAISMHRMRSVSAGENRAGRMATATSEDNRISYGCINVPAAFYDRHIQPLFDRRRAVVYILPDTKTLQQVFADYQEGPAQAA